MFENKSELLQKEYKDLFGKEFHEKISEIVKDHKQSKQLLASAIFKDLAGGNQLFQKSPPPNKQHRGGKVLTKTKVSETIGTPTGITSTIVNM